MRIFEDKVIAITGAGGGIGRSLAQNLAKKGARLALSDVDPKTLAETKTLLDGADVLIHTVDVAKRKDLDDFAQDTAKQFGQIDGIINNAGVALSANTAKTTLSDFEWIMQINFWGVVHGTQAFLPYIREAKAGLVANVSSIFGLIAFPDNGAYNASKFAVRGYTEALRIDLAADAPHIHVVCIHPGGIKTNIAKAARMGEATHKVTREQASAMFNKAAISSADFAARTILNGVQDGKNRILIGPDAKRVDLIQRLFPEKYVRYVKTGFSKRM